MATLVQTTPAAATAATTRHQSQSYPLVRPSSASSSARPSTHHQHQHQHQQAQQQPQMYHLVSAPPPPAQMMYQQSSTQTQQFVAMNYDYTRQTYQAQQAAKHHHHHNHQYHQQQQQQRRPNSTHPLRPQFQTRSRSEEALREKSLLNSNPMEAQSAPLPADLRHSIVGLMPPPAIAVAGQSRPSSADGGGSRPGSAVMGEGQRYSRGGEAGYGPRAGQLGGYGHQPRYSAEDVTTIKNMNSSTQGYVTPPFPVHPRYQNLQQYGHGGSRLSTLQPVAAGYLGQPPSPHGRPVPS